ncbi:MAG: 2-oxoacid:acceptor oxidoreductase family protein [Planctomycetes bacterium]|nr:2-oxoacid:acceptor oxidoreductase family protein [Planctomycetota bacterium]
MKLFQTKSPDAPAANVAPKYVGVSAALDGSAAVVEMETAASDAAGAYPITPSTQMGEGWAQAVAEGRPNVNGRPLLFFEPEGEHAAAAVTTGMSMTGLRATNFSSGQGIAYMHESLYPAVGKRLTYVLNMACRAMTKHSLNVHCGHDDYHAIDDTGFFQIFAKDVQGAADLNLVSHRVAELSLNPGICAQDGFLTSHVIESLRLPERDLIREYLGDACDVIDSPTPAQRMVFGETRRRIPEMFDLDYPAMLGVVQNQDSYAQGVAAQRPFYFDHVAAITDGAFAEYEKLTGRHYARAMGYRIEDAEWVLVGMGSFVSNAEAVCDHLRAERGLKVGVLDVTMFRPFPADLVTQMLRGKKGVAVMERTDQPLAADGPLLREIRAAMSQAMENGRAGAAKSPAAKGEHLPHPGLASISASESPEFFAGCYGLGSRDFQPGDLIAVVENMLPGGRGLRRFYVGIDFVRKGTRLPKLQIWQEKILDAYPHLAELALEPAGEVNLLPKDSVAVRIHSVGGWGAITMGKNLTMTVFELFGLHVKANPKYGSEKKGQPTTFYATFAPERIRLNCELRHVDVVLSPDPNVFRHTDPILGLSRGGALVIQCTQTPQEFWDGLSARARRAIRDRGIRLFLIDAFKVAREEATGADMQFRMQGAAFMGAFFKASPIAERAGLDGAKLFAGIRDQLQKKFGKLGDRVVEENVRVVRRGFDEVKEIAVGRLTDSAVKPESAPAVPPLVEHSHTAVGFADPGRFWEQVCSVQSSGQDPLADPFAAMSAIPASTGTFRDMTGIRYEVPKFIAEKCTGCGQCWTQCPDAAIPGVVSEPEDVLRAAMDANLVGAKYERFPTIVKHVGGEVRKLLRATPKSTFAAVLPQAYESIAKKMGFEGDKRATLDAEFAMIVTTLEDLPVARTGPFFDVPEGKKKDAGGLLSVTVNPQACKGCNLCIEVCPDGALVAIKQDAGVIDHLRRGWAVWDKLPDTPDRFVNVTDLDDGGIGVLQTLLLKKATYRSMVGGDGACMGCGEKTGVHLIVSTIQALMQPRVAKLVVKLDDLIAKLDAKGRALLAASADLDAAAASKTNGVQVKMAPEAKARLDRIEQSVHKLKDLRWRYVEGPGGKGRASLGMSNSTGCSSVWASTYPYNPYPFPWANHLFQDAASVAIGVFEGHMRKMADGFREIRRAGMELADAYDPAVQGKELRTFDWHDFDDEEFHLCPPIIAMGGDGAMLDIGFQNVSRLFASGKPIRVIMLDTQVYSNTGGQACTSGFTGQVSDMAAYGKAQHGKQETRKEMALLAMAHRNTFVLQSSQASPSHLIGGVLRGLQARRPSIFVIYTPCPVEHGLADDASEHASRWALESRAFPFMVYDPAAGKAFSDCLSLDGNPSPEDDWPMYDLEYVDDAGATQKMTLPVTIADWAATETRFSKHFKKAAKDSWSDAMIPFHEVLKLAPADRVDRIPFIWVKDAKGHLGRMTVTSEMITLAEERLHFWSQLRQLAGLEVSSGVEDGIRSRIEAEFESKLSQFKTEYPRQVARRLAESLMALAKGSPALAELLSKIPADGLAPVPAAPVAVAAAPTPAVAAAATPAASPVAAPAVTASPSDDGPLSVDAWIDTPRCTSCNECINVNRKVFAYNDKKQATVVDAKAGSFKDLVLAAEKCPVSIIHPGTPLDPKEKDVAKWVKRAERFQ